jgi:hypothetical protein
MDNMNVKVMLIVSSASKEGIIVAKKVFEVIRGKIAKETLKDLDLVVIVHDVMTHGDIETESPCIIFGTSAKNRVKTSASSWMLPPANSLVPGKPENDGPRRDGLAAIEVISKELSDEISALRKKEEDPVEMYVEKEGVTVGKTRSNIEITEQEAEYLKRIRDLLDGGKMVITKGDYKIEVE